MVLCDKCYNEKHDQCMGKAGMTADTEKKLIELKATALVYKPYEIDDIIETIHKVKMVL